MEPEKPREKVPIPGTDGWLRVTTTHGNVFYAQKKTKRSEWTIPDEIRPQVVALERSLGIEPGEEEEEVQEEVQKEVQEEGEGEREHIQEHAEDVQSEDEERSVKRARMDEPSPPIQDEFADIPYEQGKAMYMEMLTSLNGTSKEINPMAPWDHELPKFVHERAYRALPTLEDREEVFNEWCKYRLREKRAKAKAGASEDAFRTLLRKQVASTRATFSAFCDMFQRDPAYTAFVRDFSQAKAESVFNAWIAELKERKLAKVKEAEQAFLALLGETFSPTQWRSDEAWPEAKKTPGLAQDKRYEAVGSSTRRAELFGEWLRGAAARAPSRPSKAERQAQALSHREAQVRRERARNERQAQWARTNALDERRETEFHQRLLDSIHDPWADWDDARRRLGDDPLPEHEKRALFDEHMLHLRSKRRDQLAKLFAKHAKDERGVPQLQCGKDVILPLVRTDPAYTESTLPRFVGEVAGVHKHAEHTTLEAEFDAWDAWRQANAEQEFQAMLRENAFVDFWGRLQKEKQMHGDEKPEPMMGEEEGDDEEATVSILDMASQLDVQAMESVLKADQRYRMFSHVPEHRTAMVRAHLRSLSVPKRGVRS